jgi:hypothetical protein
VTWSETILGPHPEALLVGGFLIAVYQTAKFSELNFADPTTSRYIGRFHNLTVKDLAGAATYRFALIIFVLVSLLLYYLVCQISEPVVGGAIKILTGVEPSTKGVPFPLYIAALFMGLTQPVIPGLAKLADAQRNFFHDQMHVPGRIIHLSESLTTAINARGGTNRRQLMAEVKKLSDDAWRQKLQSSDGDLAFYNAQLEKADLGDPSKAAQTLRGASLPELRELIATLVLSNLIAVMRKSGPKQLGQIVGLIDPQLVVPPAQLGRVISGLLLAGLLFGLAVLTIWHALDFMRPLIPSLVGSADLWPNTEYLGVELGRIVPSIFICLLISVAMLPQNLSVELVKQAEDHRSSLSADFLIEFGRSIASILIICFAVSLTIHFTAEFYQYGTAREVKSDISITKLVVVFVRTMPSVAVAYCALLYLFLRQHRRASLTWILTVMTIAVAALSLLVALTFLRLDFLPAFPNMGSGWDYTLFYVLANMLVSMAAFLTVILFSRTQTAAPPAVGNLRKRLRRRLATT